ncbi:cellulase family glycosylhydrolase [Hamadaea tsunoensis]|uniref:cellulase family glycosylhydrolase n=1 Tax=Hamadaea tsunoensis TaxID=53368 RepID=UPI0004104E74|nr:cellulase family glycosylhydrolase [Hamadaea tsunoensis]
MKRLILALGSAVLAVVASTLVFVGPAEASVGLHISGRNIVEANGQNFIMRGVNHEHVWFTGQTSSFANIKALGANTVRVVLGSGKRWGPSTDVANVVSLCKQNKLICVLEVHDTTGYGEDSAAATLDEAVNYWITQKANLVGQESYIVINIGNEPIGNTNPGQWTAATTAAIQKMRTNGFEHLLMVDAPNWGQDWQYVMRDNAATVLAADTQHNTVLSIHMYDVFNTATAITDYLNRFRDNGWPLVIGEFGWQRSTSNVDDQTVMAEANARGLGYIGWSWAGNNDPYLDMTNNFDPTQLSTWGLRIFNGANGITATAKQASVYGTSTSPSASASASPSASASRSASPSASPSASRSASASPSASSGAKACTAAYTITNSWPGGFQGEVKVTAGSAAISSWTTTWTYANGQTVTQFWSATVTSSGANVTAKNVTYNGSLGAGASTSFGFLASWNGTNAVPAVTCTAS